MVHNFHCICLRIIIPCTYNKARFVKHLLRIVIHKKRFYYRIFAKSNMAHLFILLPFTSKVTQNDTTLFLLPNPSFQTTDILL